MSKGGLGQLGVDKGEEIALLHDAVEIDVHFLDRPGSEGADGDRQDRLDGPRRIDDGFYLPRDGGGQVLGTDRAFSHDHVGMTTAAPTPTRRTRIKSDLPTAFS